ncbi:hypothetical protein HN51_046854 [Arachis hypogaea]
MHAVYPESWNPRWSILRRELAKEDMRQQANETGETTTPIIVRSHVATEEHVKEAIRLFTVSIMDAARSGIHQQISLTPEMENEIKQAETQIKRRIGIGNHISERRLINDLSRMGMNKSIALISSNFGLNLLVEMILDVMNLKKCLTNVFLLTLAMLTTTSGGFVGVNIGTDVSDLLAASNVVAILKAHQITHMFYQTRNHLLLPHQQKLSRQFIIYPSRWNSPTVTKGLF